MEPKFIKVLRYIFSALVLSFAVFSIAYLRIHVGIYYSIIIAFSGICIEYLINGILDFKYIFQEGMKSYNIKMLIIKIVSTIGILVLLFIFNSNLVTQIIGYVICGLWIILLSSQEKLIKYRNDKFNSNRNNLNKKRKITTYKKK